MECRVQRHCEAIAAAPRSEKRKEPAAQRRAPPLRVCARPPRPCRADFRLRRQPHTTDMATARPPLTLSLQLADPTDRLLLPRHKVARWIRAALESPAEITVRIVDAEEGQALNRDYRAKDYATNVLTFDYSREPVVSADLVLCAPVLQRESRELNIPLAAHYAHMLVHGTLHAQGFDHETDAGARVMEARETALMRALGFADPYRK